MQCSKCGNTMADYNQDVYDAAHRMYRDWQRSRKQNEEAKLRDIAREVYEEMRFKEQAWYELKGKLAERNHKKRDTPSTSKAPTGSIPNRAGLPWTLPEDNILKDELCLFIKATAQDHARSYNAVSARLTKLYMDAAR